MVRILPLIVLLCLTCYAASSQRECVSHEYLQQEIKRDPKLAQRIAEIESFSSNVLNKEIRNSINSGDGGSIPVIKIPVVVHILYYKTEHNISEAQVKSQIEALNNDFRRTNLDASHTPLVFQEFAADCTIEFELANIDPKGRPTSGIIRKQTGVAAFGSDDRIKFSSQGGDDAWDSDKYLNIWVGNTSGGLIGYSSVVGISKLKDGIVIRNTAFGTTGIAVAPFNKGRTATHEIGHWLGLRHIWGDQYCGNDWVDDTPPQKMASQGCPSGTVVSCSNEGSGGNMYMNYMDLTSDECMNMFTVGQREKMRSLFQPGGPRNALLSSNGCSGEAIPDQAPVSNDSTITHIKAYPNPAFQTITIDLGADETLIGKTISLYNHLGQRLSQTLIRGTLVQLTVTNLKEGFYFVRIDGRKETVKIIKGGARQ